MAKGIISINNHSSSGGGGGNSKADLLWDKNDAVENTTYTLDTGNIEDYDFVLVMFRTNWELTTQQIPVSYIKDNYNSNVGIMSTFVGGSGWGQSDMNSYRAMTAVYFLNSTQFNFKRAYNSGNLTIRPIQIYGIKY